MNDKLYIFLFLLFQISLHAQSPETRGGAGRGDAMVTGNGLVLQGPPRFNGGDGRGDHVVSGSSLALQGPISLPRFAGGIGRGDDMGSTAGLAIQGLTNPDVHARGGAGRGDAVVTATGIILQGPPRFNGGEGRGDHVASGNNLAIQGPISLPRFAGGIGRGDDMGGTTGLTIQGLTNPDVHARGGAGRGDAVVTATGLILQGPPRFNGGDGRGDHVVSGNNLTIQGPISLPRFAGGIGRGDDMGGTAGLVIRGLCSFTAGVIASTGQTVAIGGNPSPIGSLTDAGGGDNNITYQWRANGNVIAGAIAAAYDPPAGIVSATVYTRWAKDGDCSTEFTKSAGEWVVDLDLTHPDFTDPADVTFYTDTDDVACPANNSISPAASQTVPVSTGGAAFNYTVNGVTRSGPTGYSDLYSSGADLKLYLWAVNLNRTGTSSTCSRQIELTWRVYDADGNYTEQSQIITIVDRTKPTFTRPADGTFPAPGCTYVQQLPAVTGDVTNESDNCQTGLNANWSDGAPVAGSCPGTFTVNRTWSLVDGCGNAAASQVQVITIAESTAPTVSSTNSPNDPDIDNYACGASFTYDAGPSTCFINKTVAKPSWTDACGASVVRSQSADNSVVLSNYGDFVGANFPVGTTIVTFSATDCPGNTGYCTLSITVNDTQNPTITGCPTNQTVLADPGLCSRSLNLVVPTAGDNCSVTAVNHSTSGATTLSGAEFPNSLTFNQGITTVVYTAFDGAGNTRSCTFNITITDPLPPVAACKNATVQLNSLGTVTIPGSLLDNGSTDNCSLTFTPVPATFTCSNLGANTVTLNVSDGSNTRTCTAVVTVQDVTPPTSSCRNYTLQLDATGNGTLAAANIDNASTDACGITSRTLSKTAFTCADLGLNTVVLTVTDASGYTSTCTCTVSVQDITAPAAVCRNVTAALSGNSVTVTAAQVNNNSTDACGIASMTLSPNTFNCSHVGSTNLTTLSVYDASGNAGTCIATVTVLSAGSLVAKCDTITVQLDGNSEALVTLDDVDDGSFDACSQVALTVPDWFTAGTDCASAVCISDTIQLRSAVNGADGGYASNCPISSSFESWMYFQVTTPGTIDMMIESTPPPAGTTYDAAVWGPFGSPATSSSQLNTSNEKWCELDVSGGRRIEFTAPAGYYMLMITNPDNEAGYIYLNDNKGTAGIAMPCTANNTTNTHIFRCNERGRRVVTLRVTDTSGNSKTCNAVVNVQDLVPPTIVTCPANSTLPSCGSLLPDFTLQVAAYDNCSYTVQQHPAPFVNVGDFDGDTTIVTFIVRDSSLNETRCASVVTIDDTNPPTPFCRDMITLNLNSSGTAPLNITGAIGVDIGSVDDCTPTQNLVRQLTQSTFTCADIGTNVVALNVTDAAGNTANACFTTVIIQDATAPTASCQNTAISLEVTGNATVTAAQLNNGSTDNCGNLTFSPASLAYTCADMGAHTVTLTVTDASGNTGTCTSVVTVTDAISPVAYCQNISAALDATGNATVTAAQLNNGSTDNCGNLTFSPASLAYTCADVGARTVTLTVTDASGNTATCTSVVTVTDAIPPVVSCQDITVFIGDANMVMLTPGQLTSGFTDNCSGLPSFITSASLFTCTSLGPNVVTLTVTDASGNSSTCTSVVTVADNRNPWASCRNLTVALDGAGHATVTGDQINDGSVDDCGVLGPLGIAPQTISFDCNSIGANTVTLTVTDASGNTGTCTAVVTVTDQSAPSFPAPGTIALTTGSGTSCPADATVSLAANQSVQVATSNSAFTYMVNGVSVNGPTVYSDNCSAGNNLSLYVWSINDNYASSGSCSRQIQITWRVYDQNNANFAEQTQLITISDNTPPVFTRPADITINADAGCSSSPAVIVTGDVTDENDNCSASLQAVYTDGALVNVSCGVFYFNRTWRLQDDCGNAAANQVQRITVYDYSPPTVASTNSPNDPDIDDYQCGDSFTYETGPATCFTLRTITRPSWADACGGAVVRAQSADNAVLLSNFGDFVAGNFPAGTTVVTFSATDCSGNKGTCSLLITVNDWQYPVLAGCQTDRVLATDPGSCTRLFFPTTPVATDNCVIKSVEYQLTGATNDSGIGFPNALWLNAGITTVTYRVADDAGNSRSCTYTLSVADQTVPAAVCRNIAVQLNQQEAVITGPMLDNGSSDNCQYIILSAVPSVLTCSNLGSNQVTLQVSDGINTGTCMAVVTVQDTTRPMAVCRDRVMELDNDGRLVLDVTDINHNSTDNCGITSYVLSKSVFDCSNLGSNSVILTVSDASGNQSSCMALVTVQSLPSFFSYSGSIGAEQHICSGWIPAALNSTFQATGAGTAGYQWYSSNDGINFGAISGATNPSGYSPGSLTSSTWYRLEAVSTVSGSQVACRAVSNTVLIGVNSLAITGVPSDKTAAGICISQADVAAQYDTWAGSFGISGGYRPVVNVSCSVTELVNGTSTVNTFTIPTPPPADGGHSTVTWTVSDTCGQMFTATATFSTSSCMRVSGSVLWARDNSGIGSVQMEMAGNGATSGITGVSGAYNVYSPVSGSYTITPSKTLLAPVLNSQALDQLGINVYDVQAIQAHVGAAAELSSPYQLIAANVVLGTPSNQLNNRLTGTDASALSQAINGDSAQQARLVWRFVPSDYQLTASAPVSAPRSWGLAPQSFSGSDVPVLYGAYPVNRVYPSLNGAFKGQDFIAVKVGDVVPNHISLKEGGQLAFRYGGNPLVWKLLDTVVEEGAMVEAVFRADQMIGLKGWQFGIQFDPEYLKIDTLVTTGVLSLDPDINFGRFRAAQGEVSCLWADANAFTLDQGESVFSIRFTGLKGGKSLSELLRLDEHSGFALSAELDPVGVMLNFESSPERHETPRLYQNYPNPFAGETRIGFELPSASEIRLILHDVRGVPIREIVGHFEAGIHEIQFSSGETADSAGILYYSLHCGNFTAARRMVIIR